MKTMGVIFSNIYDSSLGELTNYRTVASLPFGGRYRQIDFVLSNMSNSGIKMVGVITKYNYRSLMDHVGSLSDWDLNRKNEGLTIIPPFSSGNTIVYKGKLEALYSAVHFIDNKNYDYVLLSDSNVICNIDYRPIIDAHIRSNADVTAITLKTNSESKKYPCVFTTDKKGKVISVLVDSPAENGTHIGIGMFIIKRSVLVDAINSSYAKGYVHFERDYIQHEFNENNLSLNIYEYNGVVLRNDSIQNFYANNMKLLDADIRNGIFNDESPIFTKVRDEIPTIYSKGSKVSNCLIADGCNIKGEISNSLLFRNVTVSDGAKIDKSIIMQGSKIGKNVTLKSVILDKNVVVRDGVELIGTPDHPVIIKKGEIV